MWREIVSGLLLLMSLAPGLAMADGGAAHQAKQTPPVHLGASGGNVNHTNVVNGVTYCCSGTLGSLVTKGGKNYILSNNHVLARSNSASVGEDIIHPGFIDVGCNANNATVMADLSQYIPLGQGTFANRVDAAIAEIRKDINGNDLVSPEILDIGLINPTMLSASVGLPVMKSGRTTGLTYGAVQAINMTVFVQYQRGCGTGSTFYVLYGNQIAVSGTGFSAGGDSGSLIVSNSSSSCTRPVGLLFAGSSTTTIANPVSKVSSALGGLTFVGGNPTFVCTGQTSATSTSVQLFGPSQAAVDHARGVKERHEQRILAMPGMLGTGVGVADDDPSEAVIIAYLHAGRPFPEALLDRLDGVRVKIVTTEPFVAYGNKRWGDPSCAGK